MQRTFPKGSAEQKFVMLFTIGQLLEILGDEIRDMEVVYDDERAFCTVPLVSKNCNIRMIHLATDIVTSEMTKRPLTILSLKEFHGEGIQEIKNGLKGSVK